MAGWTTNGVAAVAGASLSGAEQFAIDTEYAQGISPQSASVSLTEHSKFLRGQAQNGPNFRNFLDGGDFGINPWQRGTANVGGNIANSTVYTADRWFASNASAGASINVSQSAALTGSSALAGFNNALQFQRTAGNANTATLLLGQAIETADSWRAQGQVMTLSFWARAGASFNGGTGAGPLGVQLVSGAGTNQTGAQLAAGSWTSQANAINSSAQLTSAWQRFSFTTAAALPAALTQIGVLFSYAPSGTAGANDWFQIAGVQLEVGPAATAFEFRDAQVELEICQRYCFAPGGAVGAIGTGAATSTTAAGFFVNFPVQMRTAPSALAVTTVGDLSVYSYANASVAALTGLSFGSASPNGCHATATVASGLTAGTPYVLYVATGLAGNVVFSADL